MFTENANFEDWETALEPKNFNLISILKFRRKKEDFSFNKSVEHTNISKFISNVATMDEKWRNVASDFSVSKQSQWEDVKLFWNKIDLEKIETSSQMLEKRVYQAETEQQVQATENASRQMDLIQNIFINKSEKRGHDLQVDEASKRPRSSDSSKLTESNDQEQSFELLSSSLYSSQETIADVVDNPFFVSNKATALTKYIRDQESEKISSELPSVEESARDPILEFPDDPPELNDEDVIVYNKKTMRDAYSRTRQDIYDRTSQKDWWIEQCNISNNFREYQVANIDILEDGGTFCFSTNYEEILSLHHIMLIDLTNMKKPLYVLTDERNWRTAVRQPIKPKISSFFRDVMDDYEMVINDIDLLRLKYYEMWGRYCDQVIYSDSERRLFETTQAVTRAFYERMHMSNSEKVNNEDTVMHEYIHDTFKETFRDSNYDTIWANGESLSSKYHRATYGRNKGKKPDMVLYRIIENGEREESCFIEAKHFSITRNSNIGGYNMYKVAIFCQGGLNKMMSSYGGDTGASFGGHICEGHIYFCMMDLKYDGIYRFFQLSEVKLARKLSEFNLVRRLIMEAFFFKVNLSCCCQTVPKISRTYLVLSFVYHIQCRIDDFYSNRNGSSNQYSHNNLSRRPTISPKAPRNSVPSVSLIDKTKRKTRNIKEV
ncbi:unnamed protein product [Rhizophagus irregularis]|uniref:Uncharacterized protein n=1 Tax=Rhizophagus irregularis TaxID=588596 RepID=A0A915Z5Z2_9GLOM|nr:unnamed protein product [Rhizophagus irregularis]CAB5364032.1 unnamed protein product [Rhizophagus irregularis]